MTLLDRGSGYNGCNIGEDIAHRRVEDKTVNWLVKCLGAEEGDGNEEASC